MRVLTALAIALLAAPPLALGHAELVPGQVTQGGTTEVVLRVPSERPVPTTAVRVAVPETVLVIAVGETPRGWRAQTVTGDDGTVAAVVFSGGTIGADRYADFPLLIAPRQTGTTIWPTEQTYSDGVVVAWTEEPAQASNRAGEPGPAPTLAVGLEGGAAAPATPAAPQDGEPATPEPAPAPAAPADDDSGAAIWLGVIAIAIAALAAIGTGLLWSTRPARLPEDER